LLFDSTDAVVAASVFDVEAATVDVALFVEQHPPAFLVLAVFTAVVPQSSALTAVDLSVAQWSALASALSVAQWSALAVDAFVAFVEQHDAFLAEALSSQRAPTAVEAANIEAAQSAAAAMIVRAFMRGLLREKYDVCNVVSCGITRRFHA
jgi:hypothetical protein